jgi:neutral ceramidase
MKTFKPLFTFLIILGLFVHSDKLSGITGKLLAGTAKVNITPKGNQALHDSLYARSLVLDINGQRIAFVSVDLAIYTSPILLKICKEKYGISQLFLSSSHTHSGARNKNDTFCEDQILSAIGKSIKNMFPARISAGHQSFPQLGFNRLVIREDGHSRESWFSDDHYMMENPERIPFGPVDPEVGVIKIEDMKGQPRVVMMNYAMHADIVCSNYAISADYPGVACRKVEEAFGNNLNCLFVQGAGGNIESLIISGRRSGPNDPFQTDYYTITRVGELLAYETIKLTKNLHAEGDDETDIKYMNDSLKFTGRFDKKTEFNIHISTILINNNIVVATCPGEPFVQLQLEWKEKIKQAKGNPFLFGYTWYEATWPNYIPDITSAARGGYGADQNTPVGIAVGAGEMIMNKHLENYLILNGLMRDKPGPIGFKSGSRWNYIPTPPIKF